jgi:type II secretion system protein J
MNFREPGPDRSAFTLIEVMISTALMALILTSAYFCLSAGTSSQKLVESRGEVIQSARVAMSLISADLRAACSLSKDIEFLGMQRKLGEAHADNLDFATHNYIPRHVREADFCEISYFLSADPDSTDFILWRRRDPTPDPEPLAGGSREEIARGLAGLRFEYYDGFDWYNEWGDPQGKRTNSFKFQPNLSGLPEAVRVTMSFNPSPRKKAATPATNEQKEPPLVFQTVARLNLADASLAVGGGGASSTNRSTTATAPSEGGSQ